MLITPNFAVYPRDIDGNIIGGSNNLNNIENLKSAQVNHLGFDNGRINGIGRWMFTKDISNLKNEEALMNSFDFSTRKAIRKTIKNRIIIKQLDYDELDQFKQLTEITSKRLQYRDRNLNYYQSLKTHFKDNCKVISAQLDVMAYRQSLVEEADELTRNIEDYKKQIAEQHSSKKIVNRLKVAEQELEVLYKHIEEAQSLEDGAIINIGAVIFMVHSNEMTALFAGNDADYFGFNGSHAIHYAAICEAVKLNLDRYNFYGTRGPYMNVEEDGVYRFKKGFGGQVLEQPGNFELIVNPFMNQLYQIIHKIKS